MIIKESKIRSFKLFNEGIIDEFIKKHSDRYDYSKVDYINSKTNVEIVCPIHGSFFQNPYSHKMGSNCPKCVNRKKMIIYHLLKLPKKYMVINMIILWLTI
jgi:hypothetical protein